MDLQLVDFESFFNQLIPLTEHDHRIMYGSQQGFFPNDNTHDTNGQYLDNNFASEVVVKQEQKGKVDHGSPTNSSPPFDDNLDDNERQKARRANQNLACRNYRRRKKEYVSELEGRIQKLEAENDQLRKENTSFRRNDPMDVIDANGLSVMMEMKQILERLDDAVKNNLDDRSISYLLQIFFLATEKRHIAHEKEVDKLVDPLTQAKLATLGYVPSLENPVIAQMYGPSGVEWWEAYMKEASITPEQADKMTEMRERLWKVDGELRVERSLIDKQIKEFYLKKLKLVPSFDHGNPTNSNLEMSEVVEFARQLNSLKKNFTAQRTLILEIQCQLTKILQPRQHAILMLKVNQSRTFDWPRHVQTLKSAWQLFSDKANNGMPGNLINPTDPSQTVPSGSAPPTTYLPPSSFSSPPSFSPTGYPQGPMHATIIQNNYIHANLSQPLLSTQQQLQQAQQHAQQQQQAQQHAQQHTQQAQQQRISPQQLQQLQRQQQMKVNPTNFTNYQVQQQYAQQYQQVPTSLPQQISQQQITQQQITQQLTQQQQITQQQITQQLTQQQLAQQIPTQTTHSIHQAPNSPQEP